ncbi:uncharacterized protein LOC129959435 [Argiope bruennichi]|uniref:uncharacterized protein LOC129959435 n=1 Tax=Argiope bruennichi TaxID=94029 RepID=UPI0024945B3C|nr:uncharacterized protein LOC129959435 [Argiope bruennichi]
MAQNTENENIVMGQKIPEKRTDYIKYPDEFEVLELQLGQAIKRMWVIQTRLDRRVFTSKKFMYEAELNKLTQEVDRCTQRLKLLKLKDEEKTRKIMKVLIVLLLISLFRFVLVYF